MVAGWVAGRGVWVGGRGVGSGVIGWGWMLK